MVRIRDKRAARIPLIGTDAAGSHMQLQIVLTIQARPVRSCRAFHPVSALRECRDPSSLPISRDQNATACGVCCELAMIGITSLVYRLVRCGPFLVNPYHHFT